MKEAHRSGLLKLLALLAINIYIYSAVSVLRSVIFRDDGGMGLLALYAAFLCAGFLVSGLLLNEDRPVYGKIAQNPVVRMLLFTFNITEKTRFVASTAIYASLLLPVAAAFLLFRDKGILRCVFEVVFLLPAWLLPVKHRYSGFARIMSNAAAGFGLVIMLASLETAGHVRDAAYLQPYLYAAAYVFMLLFLIIRNQEDIDVNIYSRKHIERSILPRNLRSFNTLAVFVLFSAILLLFNLRSVVAWIIATVSKLAGMFLMFLLWLYGRILSGPDEAESVNNAPQAFGFYGVGSGVHPYENFLSNILKYFIILYLVYRLGLFLIRRLPRVAAWIARLLKKLLSWGKAETPGESGDYDDETEIVKPPKERDRRHSMRALIRSRRRDLKSITDPVERIRFLYASLIEILRIYGIQADKSDTTFDILKKAEAIRGIGKPLSLITRTYNTVRYGDSIPGQDILQETEMCYNETVELIKRGDTSLPPTDRASRNVPF